MELNQESPIRGNWFPVSEYIIAEYNSLREEILKRTEFQFQILGLTLLIAGSFLTVGTQTNVSALTLSVYPILATSLAAFWANNYVGTIEAGAFIRAVYESNLPEPIKGWESFNYQHFSVEKKKN